MADDPVVTDPDLYSVVFELASMSPTALAMVRAPVAWTLAMVIEPTPFGPESCETASMAAPR